MTPVQISNIRVERYASALGIGHASPRVSWSFEGSEQDWKQESYEIKVTGKARKAETKTSESSQNTFSDWPGRPLVSKEGVEVSVRAKSTKGTFTDWKIISVEAGYLERSDWACGVTLGPEQSSASPKRPFQLRNTFKARQGGKARIYVTALGVYEISINGQIIHDSVLSPGWQSYENRIHYNVYDIDRYVKEGDNEIKAWIGEGWYAGRLGFGGGKINNYGDDIGLIAQLEIDDEVVLSTGSDGWKWSYGKWIGTSIYDGSTYDDNEGKEEWKEARSGKIPSIEVIVPEAPPVRRVMELKTKEIISTPSGKTILDFGQNLVGWARINSPAPQKGKISLRHAEVLEHGELGTRPLRIAKATDEIACSSQGTNLKGWEPLFTFHGFRYVEVSGWDGELDLETMSAIVTFTDMDRLGDFECSHKGMNQWHSNTVWGLRGNFLSIPTDCPQRDERLGWTGDIQAFASTASFLYDTHGMLGDWLSDLAEAQEKQGKGIVPLVIPNILPIWGPQAVWGDVSIITPLDLYQFSGDIRILEDQYESMCMWLDKGIKRDKSGKTKLWDSEIRQLADWLDPNAPDDRPGDALTDNQLVANAYLVHVTKLLSQIAGIIGKKDDQRKYEKDYEIILQQFQDEYTTKNGRLVSDTQTALALALSFNLIPPSSIQHTVDRLVFLIRWAKFKVSTGFAGTPLLLPALSTHNQTQIAYRMFVEEKQVPSILYPIRMGATTIWERWNSMLPDGSINPGEMTSFNHYALGSISNFLYNHVIGLKPLEPGWKRIQIKPEPGGPLTFARGYHITLSGKVSCIWEIKGDKLVVDVVVPPNTTAEVILPGESKRTVGSGEYHWEVEYKKDESWPPQPIRDPFDQTPEGREERKELDKDRKDLREA